MNLTSLLEHFDSHENLHIEVNAVRDQVVTLGFQDEIRFHFVNIEENILRGLLFRYTKHAAVYGDPIRCSEICIAKSLSPEWRRLVAVKELLHITDTEDETAQSEAAVEKLIQRLSLPFEIREETKSSLNDRTHIIPALAVLVPKGCRDILRPIYKDGKITTADIANMAQIPERYSDLIMGDLFEDLIAAIKTQAKV
jgi:hypothetical protein